MRQPRLALAAAAAVVGLSALGFAPADAAPEITNEITASGVAFTPMDVVVKPDTEVTWHIGAEGPDGLGHQILLDDEKADCSGDSDCKKKNDSGYMGSGLDFRRKFSKVGDYPYHCKVHQGSGMVGIVRVTEDGQPPATTSPTTAPPPPPPPPPSPPTTAPPATAPPTTAPRPAAPPPAPAATTTTTPAKATAAGKTAKPPKTTTTQGPTTTTLPPETTTTVPPLALPPLAEKGPLMQAPVVESTTTTLPAAESGEEGFVAVNKGSRRGGVKKMTYAAVGALGLSLVGGGVAWWRRRPSRYWSA